ncbi:flagellar hook-associated protein 3 [Blastococcus sp. TBT05-19]|uniref:flagellar hook-associated protein FlgL n=1 Tax=Blastococcus sp. TBT05-19 TaxID=2250581 RepID=UPI000DEB3746|nr:flagellar hook-associated protein FlgL [Blastococcus sp. TBT05-19]RBY94318.1 flagellar hook-associated protein 3 [Blastococcus sp. TBT05-19]
MRITQRAVALTSLQGLNRNLDAFGKLQQQLTSGRLLSAPSDSPTGTNRAMQTRSDQEATSQFVRNIADGKSWLDQTDATLQQMMDVTRRVRDLAVQGSNTGAMSDTAGKALAAEVSSLRESLLGLANTTVAGRPLFGGITAGAQAYHPDTGAYLGTTDTPVARRVSTTEEVRIDISGVEAFGSQTAGADLFAIVDDIATHLEGGGAGPDALAADLAALDERMSAMMFAVADVGARSARMEREGDIALDQGIVLETRLAEVENIDLPNTIMRLQMQQTGYEAALAATAKALSPTLLDYLR